MRTLDSEHDTTVTVADEPPVIPAGPATSSSRYPRRIRVVLALAVILAVAAVSSWAYLFFAVRPDDEALAPDRQQAAVDAATKATTAILSYKAETVDADLDVANALITGTFGDYYRTFTRDVVAPAAKEKKISTTATVVGSAISEFGSGDATVVVFVDQSTTTADMAEPSVSSTTIRIELERHGDVWLVSKFDPS